VASFASLPTRAAFVDDHDLLFVFLHVPLETLPRRLASITFHRSRVMLGVAEAMSADQDSVLADIRRVHLSLYVDVLGVSDEILAQVPAQRIAQQ
jgi:hypothetical protein